MRSIIEKVKSSVGCGTFLVNSESALFKLRQDINNPELTWHDFFTFIKLNKREKAFIERQKYQWLIIDTDAYMIVC